MSRQPRNVLVFVYRLDNGRVRFLLIRRADNGIWQSVCGGVEGAETLEDAARRELREEVALADLGRLTRLDMVSGVPRTGFSVQAIWPPDLYIVEKHFFAVEYSGPEGSVRISHEHTALEWLDYEQALERLRFTDEKSALWELRARIEKGDLS